MPVKESAAVAAYPEAIVTMRADGFPDIRGAGKDTTPFKRGMGWLRDNPDIRDFDSGHDEVVPMLAKLDLPPALPASVDLTSWCSPIEDQGQLGSCTAHAGAGLIEYMENRANGGYTRVSRLFLYKATRDLMHTTGDSGAWLRSTMGAMVCFGVPPEEYWAYNIACFDVEPTAFCYAFGADFKALKYFRLDPAGTPPKSVVDAIKTYLSIGVPSMFGFPVYQSITQAGASGAIPFPSTGEKLLGGHAIDAVGYNDNVVITNTLTGKQTTGAFLIRNSWGTGWGNHGYGWLPYQYVLSGLAVDWWILLSQAYVETGKFKP